MCNEQVGLVGDSAPVRGIHRGLPGYYMIFFPSLKTTESCYGKGRWRRRTACGWKGKTMSLPITRNPTPSPGKRNAGRCVTPGLFTCCTRKRANHFTEVKPDFQQLKARTRFNLDSFVVQCQAWQIEKRRADKQQLMPPCLHPPAIPVLLRFLR